MTTKNRTTDQALEKVAKAHGISVDELVKLLNDKPTPEFSAEVVETEKYGWMLHVKSSLVKPFYLSRNKARTVMAVIDKIKTWAETGK